MAIKLYNTLRKKKEKFIPLKEGKVGIYVCGVTVYDSCHIGHARALVVFDVIFRYLKYRGYQVTYVRNFTDVDDKIINRANQEGVDYNKIAERYIDAFKVDVGTLGVEDPTVAPLASHHINDIVQMIEKLIDRGYAYQVEGNVYFSVNQFSGYGKLSGKNVEELKTGARVEVDERKHNPLDFALWKAGKEGEPFWDSPWGNGRPGWHIECSAMSQKYLGDTFDIHGGGMDLIFPHHENEIAQSEAATGKPFVNYWIHNGFVKINKEKMSKSLGNFFTIKKILEQYHPEVVRVFLLSNHYRSPVDFSWQNLAEAKTGLERMYVALKHIDEIVKSQDIALSGEELKGDEKIVYRQCLDLLSNFEKAMDDDFNTAQVIGYLYSFARRMNGYMDRKGFKATPHSIAALLKVKETIAAIGKVLGILVSPPGLFFESQIAAGLGKLAISKEEIAVLIEERNKARKENDWSHADDIRNQLQKKGIILEDSAQGTVWKIQ